MTLENLAYQRLISQGITRSTLASPAEVVSYMGAIQAQDYQGAKWAVGLRLPGSTDAVIERTIAERAIVRTWALRGTLHFVAAQDVGWLLALVAPVIIRKNSRRYRELGLEERTLTQSCEVLLEALQGGRQLDRRSLRKILEENGIDTEGQRFAYMLQRASLEGLICQAGIKRNTPVFVALKDWIPKTEPLERERALAELANRYFTSHGPATEEDFRWWSGLPSNDTRAGLESVKTKLTREIIDGRVYWYGRIPETGAGPLQAYLLPVYDEYLVGYRDHSVILDLPDERKQVFKNGLISPTIVIEGRIAGTWKRTVDKARVAVVTSQFVRFTPAQKEAFEVAARRYSEFLGVPVEWE
jgi:hypothetical protein